MGVWPGYSTFCLGSFAAGIVVGTEDLRQYGPFPLGRSAIVISAMYGGGITLPDQRGVMTRAFGKASVIPTSTFYLILGVVQSLLTVGCRRWYTYNPYIHIYAVEGISMPEGQHSLRFLSRRCKFV